MNFKEKKDKYIALIIIVFLIVAIIVLSARVPNSRNTTKDFENSPTIASQSLFSEASDKMPDMSAPTYETEEYRLLHDVITEGAIIYQYKNYFINRQHVDYDIEARYDDFNVDFERYYQHIGQTISHLRSLNPTYVKAQQKETVDDLIRFYKKIGEYKKHNTHLKDTIQYLTECSYELQRVRNTANRNFDSFTK